jgi:hypothetical protein
VLAAEAFDHPDRWIGRTLDTAGDARTMAEVPPLRSPTGAPNSWDVPEGGGPDVTAMVRLVENVGYDVDVPALRQEFPGSWTFPRKASRGGPHVRVRGNDESFWGSRSSGRVDCTSHYSCSGTQRPGNPLCTN